MAVNVIIPIKDTAPEYFEQCLYSLATQTKKTFLTTVIDDGSTEENYQKYLNIINKMPFGIFFKRLDKNIGPGRARQIAMDLAPPAADYFTFLDSDDMFYPRAIDLLLSEAKVNNADIITTRALAAAPHRTQDSVVGYEIIAAWATGKLFRRRYLEENEIRFSDKLMYAEDSYFGLISHNFTTEKYAIPEIIYYWRHNEQSVTRTKEYNFLDKYNLDHFASQYEGANFIRQRQPTWNFGGVMAILYSCYQYSKAMNKINELEEMDIMLKQWFSDSKIITYLKLPEYSSLVYEKLEQSKNGIGFLQTYRIWEEEMREKFYVV